MALRTLNYGKEDSILMGKWILSVALLFLGMTMLSSFMEGGGGLVSTYLSGDITATVTTIPVAHTGGFLAADTATIGNETFAYTGTTAVSFTGVTRGSNGTEATLHVTNQKVYGSELSPFNAAMGFNIASIAANAGAFSAVVIPYKFFTISVPRMIMFDYSFFAGQMVYVQIFFQAIGLAFALIFAIWLASIAWGIFGK